MKAPATPFDQLAARIARVSVRGGRNRAARAELARLALNDDGSAAAPTTFRRRVSRARAAIAARLGENSPILVFFRVPGDLAQGVREQYRSDVAARHRARRPLRPQNIVWEAELALERPWTRSPFELIAALCAVTGRRPIEVAVDRGREIDFSVPTSLVSGVHNAETRALFARGWEPNFLRFSGQRKTRDDAVLPYLIPTLCDPVIILRGLAELRRRYNLSGLTDEQAGRRIWQNLGEWVRGDRSDGGYFDANHDPLKPKDLRAAYAAIAWSRYAPPEISVPAYYAMILGHGPDDIQTAQSYDVFYLVGQKGRFEKGARRA